MIRVFIGYDPREAVAFHVLSHSILRRASQPVSITPIALSQLEWIMKRHRDPLQSTDFSFSRFLVPWLCDFRGHAIFMDCDQLCLANINDLWNYAGNSQFSVQVVKHDHHPATDKKFLGRVQTTYPMKNWSSVMVMDCAACWRLTPEYVNSASGLDLHRFAWLAGRDGEPRPGDERLIGSLDSAWNHLVGYDEPTGREKNLHFTEGGPWFKEYENGPFADLWRSERNVAFSMKRNNQ